jgi:hypothetical protein
MIMDKYGNYVRKCMWQLCRWGRVDICMICHRRAFDFFIPLHIDLTIFQTRNIKTKSCRDNIIISTRDFEVKHFLDIVMKVALFYMRNRRESITFLHEKS